MNSIIRKILKEDREGKYYTFVLKDLIDNTVVLKTNPYDNKPCVRYAHYSGWYENEGDCEGLIDPATPMEHQYRLLMLGKYGIKDMVTAKEIWHNYIDGVEEKFMSIIYGEDDEE